MQMQRRSFISGLAALMAAPAIVRRGSLMEMRATAHYGSGSILTAEMIAEEGARIYASLTSGRACLADPIFPVALTEQFHVTYRHRTEDRQLSIEDYSQRIIAPIVHCLAEHAIAKRRPLATAQLAHPAGCEVATHRRRNVPLRFISGTREFDGTSWARFDAGVS